jgi:small-conductance mechanosensitive channel
MQDIFDHILKQSIAFAPKFGIALIIFFLSWQIGSIIKKIIFRISKDFDEGKKHVLRLLGSSIRVAILIFGGVTALGNMGMNISALVAGLGLTGFAVGFALKDALSNILSGALILIYQPFICGDYIIVSGCEGKVIEINLRYTVLQG